MKTKGIIFFMLILLSSLCADNSWQIFDDSQVAIIEITVDESALSWMYQNVWSDSMHTASVHFQNTYIDETIEEVGFRLRGNTSRVSQKKSFKLSFNTFVPGRQFYDVEKLNLNSEHNDPSIIRSKLCWDNYEQIGQIATNSSHAAVYINDQYYGLYVMIEHIDEEFLKKYYSDDSGNLWKCHYPARLTYIGDDPDDYKFMNNGSRVYELKTNTDEDDYSQLFRLIDILNNTPEVQMMDSLESVVDISSVVKYLAVDVLTGSWDDYWYGKSNYYIYHQPADDKFHVIPYDYDNTFGVDWQGIDWTQRDIYQFKHPDANRPLADVIMENDQYRDLYSHFLEFYLQNSFQFSNWEPQIDEIKEMITYYAEIDSFRTYDYGFTISDFHNSYSENYYDNQHVKKGLKQFILERNASIQQQLNYTNADPVIYNFDYEPQVPLPDDIIQIDLSAFSNNGIEEVNILFYNQDETEPVLYPMEYTPDFNSMRVENHDHWSGNIPALGENGYGSFQVVAVDVNGNEQLYPGSSRIYVETLNSEIEDICINEFLAINDNVNQDEFGEYDDWLELHNLSNEIVDLSGAYLTDKTDNLTKWQFPDNTEIQPDDYLLLWCDEDGSQGELHTNFKLSGAGEFIALVDVNGITIIDSITFGEQSPDISFGRYPDGEDWGFMQPTPQESNTQLSAEDDIPLAEYRLSNYPNPFNPSTTISFELKDKKEEVKIEIFNLKGQLIRSLKYIDHSNVKTTESFSYSVIWDGKNAENKPVTSGVYLYKLKIGGESVASRKMMLLK